MPFDEDYYKSEDFRELLDSYERAVESGSHPFMDADDPGGGPCAGVVS